MMELDNGTPMGMINQLHFKLAAHRKMIEEFTNANLEQYGNILILNQKIQDMDAEMKSLQQKLAEAEAKIPKVDEPEAPPIQ